MSNYGLAGHYAPHYDARVSLITITKQKHYVDVAKK